MQVDMLLLVRKAKNNSKRLAIPTNKFRRATQYEIHTQKSLVCLYINNLLKKYFQVTSKAFMYVMILCAIPKSE